MPWGVPFGRRSRAGCLATNRAASRKGYPTPLTLGQLMSTIIPGSRHHLLCGRGSREDVAPTPSACVVNLSTTSERAGSVPHRRCPDRRSGLWVKNQEDRRRPHRRPAIGRHYLAQRFSHRRAASFRQPPVKSSILLLSVRPTSLHERVARSANLARGTSRRPGGRHRFHSRIPNAAAAPGVMR